MSVLTNATSALSRPWLGGAVGVALFLLLWTGAALAPGTGTIIPTPWATASGIVTEFAAFYGPNLGATLERAATGYAIGNGIGIAVAILVVALVPVLDTLVAQLGVVTQCVPVTAVGPILIIVLGGAEASVILASLLVVFITLVATTLGLRNVRPGLVDVVHAYSGGRVAVLIKVRSFAALPSLFGALAVAVPASILGAVVGEFLGGLDSGVGVGLIASQREQMPERVWGMSLLMGCVALLGYALVRLIERYATPWRRFERSTR